MVRIIFNTSFSPASRVDRRSRPIPSVANEIISIDGYNNIVGIINALPKTLRDVATEEAMAERLADLPIREELEIPRTSNPALETRINKIIAREARRNKKGWFANTLMTIAAYIGIFFVFSSAVSMSGRQFIHHDGIT